MTGTAVVSGALAGAAAMAWGSNPSEVARSRLLALRRAPADPARWSRVESGRRPAVARFPLGALAVPALLCLAAVAATSADPMVVLGSISTCGAFAWLARRRGGAARRRETAAMTAALPSAADLLATCLRAGAPPAEALDTVAAATDGPLADRLRRAASALQVGAEPTEAWAVVESGDPLAPLARAFIRSSATGAPVAETVTAVADEGRRSARWSAEAAARRAGVLAVGPLAVCFLPAFVLTGVVPVVLAVAGEVLGGLR